MKRYLYTLVFFTVMLLGFAENAFAQTFFPPTVGPWIVPAGVTSVDVYCWGGGGGGGGSTTGAQFANGGGGGGGACALSTLTVIPGQSYTITIGAGGSAGIAGGGNGGAGGPTTFTGVGGTVTANGGAGGAGSAGGGGAHAGGAGGTTGTGTIHAGGGGSAGNDGTSSLTGITGTGGGGAGSTGNGTTPASTCAATGTGGTGAYPGGNGGDNPDCNTTTNLAGVAGAAYGGGGSGANCWTGTWAGGAGGAGQVVLVFTAVLNSITTSVAIPTPICAGASFNVGYTIVGAYVGGNVFTAQLSNSVGSFAAPTVIGSVASTAAGNVPVTIPAGTATGVGYLIRIISSNPAITGSNSNVLTINALPSASGAITGVSPVCQGQNGVAYSVGAIAAATSYTWAYSAGGATISGPTAAMTINFSGAAASGNLTVMGTNACGNGTISANYPITVNPIPATPGVITGTVIQCPGSAGQIYSIAAVGGATTYTWAVPFGWSITAGAGTTSITVTVGTLGQNGNITVTAGNACGSSAAQTLAVSATLTAPSTPGIITGIVNQTPTAAGQIYSIAAVAGATTYTWVVPAGWTINSGNGTTSITVTTGALGQGGNITVTAGNACATSTAQTLAVLVATALPNAGPDQYLCNLTTTATMAPSPAGGTWSQVSGPVVAGLPSGTVGIVLTLPSANTYVFRWTVGGVYDDVIVIRSP